MKRWISGLVALAMMLSILPAGAASVEATDFGFIEEVDTAVSMTLHVNAQKVIVGTRLTLTARMEGMVAPAGGTVAFYAGETPIGAAICQGGVASIIWEPQVVGAYILSAAYASAVGEEAPPLQALSAVTVVEMLEEQELEKPEEPQEQEAPEAQEISPVTAVPEVPEISPEMDTPEMPSASQEPETQHEGRTDLALRLSISPDVPTMGEAVTLTATLAHTEGEPQGGVLFTVEGVAVAVAPVRDSAAQASWTPGRVGDYAVAASYIPAGGESYLGILEDARGVTVAVDAEAPEALAQADLKVTFSNGGEFTCGEVFSLRVEVEGGDATPQGEVSVSVNDVSVGQAALSMGSTQFSGLIVPQGEQMTLAVQYGGDEAHVPAKYGPVTYAIAGVLEIQPEAAKSEKPVPEIAISYSNGETFFPREDFTLRVEVSGDGETMPTGDVIISVGNGISGRYTLENGVVQTEALRLAEGEDGFAVIIDYTGDDAYRSARLGPQVHSIQQVRSVDAFALEDTALQTQNAEGKDRIALEHAIEQVDVYKNEEGYYQYEMIGSVTNVGYESFRISYLGAYFYSGGTGLGYHEKIASQYYGKSSDYKTMQVVNPGETVTLPFTVDTSKDLSQSREKALVYIWIISSYEDTYSDGTKYVLGGGGPGAHTTLKKKDTEPPEEIIPDAPAGGDAYRIVFDDPENGQIGVGESRVIPISLVHAQGADEGEIATMDTKFTASVSSLSLSASACDQAGIIALDVGFEAGRGYVKVTGGTTDGEGILRVTATEIGVSAAHAMKVGRGTDTLPDFLQYEIVLSEALSPLYVGESREVQVLLREKGRENPYGVPYDDMVLSAAVTDSGRARLSGVQDGGWGMSPRLTLTGLTPGETELHVAFDWLGATLSRVFPIHVLAQGELDVRNARHNKIWVEAGYVGTPFTYDVRQKAYTVREAEIYVDLTHLIEGISRDVIPSEYPAPVIRWITLEFPAYVSLQETHDPDMSASIVRSYLGDGWTLPFHRQTQAFTQKLYIQRGHREENAIEIAVTVSGDNFPDAGTTVRLAVKDINDEGRRLKDAALLWRSSAEAYLREVEKEAKKQADAEKKKASRKTNADKRAEKLQATGALTNLAVPKEALPYCYQALYDLCASIGEAESRLSKIDGTKDPISVCNDIVKSVAGSFETKQYDEVHGNYRIQMDVFVKKTGSEYAFTGSLSCYNANTNRHLGTAQVSSTLEKVYGAIAEYMTELQTLEEKVLEGALRHAVEELTGFGSIGDWGKKKLSDKWNEILIHYGFGDVNSAIGKMVGSYKLVKNVLKAGDSFSGPVSDANKIATSASDFLLGDDETASNAVIDKAFENHNKALEGLQEAAAAYALRGW